MMDFKDFIGHVFYTGVGFAVESKEKIEAWAEKFVEDTKMDAEEGRKFVKQVVEKSKETREELSNFIDQKINEAIDKFGVSTKKDIDELKARIKDLEEELKKAE